MMIRKARAEDLSRIAEIYVFNNRVNDFPIFQDEGYSFGQLQVVDLVEHYLKKDEILDTIYVFDDGLIRGFMQIRQRELCKVYVDPFFQSRGVGEALIKYAVKEFQADHLWALEKNTRAIAFYQRQGFLLTGEKRLEQDTTEYLVKLARKTPS